MPRSDLVAPGEIIKYKIDLFQGYDLSEPGDYIVQVKQKDTSGNIVESNPVTLTITPAPPPSISIRISASADTFTAGSDLPVEVAVKNLLSKEIRLPYDVSDRAEMSLFEVLVTRSDGPIKITAYLWQIGGRLTPKERVSNPGELKQFYIDPGYITVEPGHTVTYNSELNQLYEMNVAGTYMVYVETTDPLTKVKVSSNTLTITVTE